VTVLPLVMDGGRMVISTVWLVIMTTVVVISDEDEVREMLESPQRFHQSTVVLVPTRAPLGGEEAGQLGFNEARGKWRGRGVGGGGWRRI